MGLGLRWGGIGRGGWDLVMAAAVDGWVWGMKAVEDG